MTREDLKKWIRPHIDGIIDDDLVDALLALYNLGYEIGLLESKELKK